MSSGGEIKWENEKLNLNSTVDVKDLEKDVATEINDLKTDISTIIEKFAPSEFIPQKSTFQTRIARVGFSPSRKFEIYPLENDWDMLTKLVDG